MMRIGVPKEIHENEKRVAMTPDVAVKLLKLGYQVSIEAGAGESAHCPDGAYEKVGVKVISSTEQLWSSSNIILKVRPPEKNQSLNEHEYKYLNRGTLLISFFWPAQNEQLLNDIASLGANVIAMDCVPRMSRAQKMDALSSMANIAGYRSVIEAALHSGKFFTGQITAAGKMPPTKILVIGAGVAGLAAIGVAHSMGAVVRAFDTRPEVKQQIESIGAEFLEVNIDEEGESTQTGYAKVMSKKFIEAEMALFKEQAQQVDIIITTALIPGKKSPILITEEMVKVMQEGSVIVDLAAERGGNCELTQADKCILAHGVKIIGYTDMPSRMSGQASQLYASNLYHMLHDLTPEKDGNLCINMEDDVIRGATVVHQSEVTWPPPVVAVSATPKQKDTQAVPIAKPNSKRSALQLVVLISLLLIFIIWLGNVAPTEFIQNFTVFVLACFVGYLVVWNVTPALHTPLMSVTNAISSVIIIGAFTQISSQSSILSLLSIVAIFITAINIGGGFFVTHLMLRMFQKKPDSEVEK